MTNDQHSEPAGDCTKCGEPVYWRTDKPGEFDHECEPAAQGDAELLPCPFCGAPATKPLAHSNPWTTWSVRCSKQYQDGCLGNGPMRSTPQAAITAWNRRTK